MGFWSSLGKGIVGGAVGFATGGPLGAAAGAASGLMSSGGNESSGTSTSTRSVNLRDLTTDQQAIQDQSTAGLLEAGRPLTPEEQEAMRKRTFSNIFDPARQELSQTYETLAAQEYAKDARRGGAGGSRGTSEQLLRDASEGREAGNLSARSTLAADQAVLQEKADRRASADAYLNRLNSVWNQRLSASSVTTTGESTSLSPDTFWQTAAAGLGVAVGDKDSYLNTNGGDIFGGV